MPTLFEVFKKLRAERQAADPEFVPPKIAAVFSPPAAGNKDGQQKHVQQRNQDQQFPNRDLPRKGRERVNITIVVDMLLTGFDAKL